MDRNITMDNDIPSSPLQQRRPTSSQSTRDAKDRANDKLNLGGPSDPNPRQCTTSPVDSTLQPWQGQQPPYPTPTSSTFPEWQEGQQWEGQVSDTVATGPPLVEIPSLPGPSSSLLTTQPLRTAFSDMSSPSRKRERSLSLPSNLSPVVKRRKSAHFTSWTPLDLSRKSQRAISNPIPLTPSSSGLPTATPVTPIPSQKPPVQVLVASRQPPVTNSSLKSLDAKEILRNPQLRHDLLFDSLAFRPVMAPSLVQPNRKNTKRANDARTSGIVADMYWESIEAEITTGCRCIRWQVVNADGDLDASVMETKQKETKCICGRFRDGYTEDQWWEWQSSRWSSRIPELVKCLRDLLLSLMGSTTPCPDPFAHSLAESTGHEATCPTLTHALIPELYASLDPQFLTIQVRRQVFPMTIFDMIGEAMKVHCAPIRDAMIEEMVQTAKEGIAARALRQCFACAEVMKLDIANHQVHTLRPHLWKTAVKDELAAFTHHLGDSTLLTSLTRTWIREASLRVLSSTSPRDRSTLISSRTELVFRSLAEGFVDLVLADYSAPSWPPVVHARLHGAASVQLAEGTETGNVVIPESLKMDSRRIKNFSADAIDLAILHEIMVMARKLWEKNHPAPQSSDTATFIKGVREDIEAAIMEAGGALSASLFPGPDVSSLSLKLVTRIYKSKLGSTGPGPTVYPPKKLKSMMKDAMTLDKYLHIVIRPESPTYTLAQGRVRQALTTILTNKLLVELFDPTSTLSESLQNARMSPDLSGPLTQLSLDDLQLPRANPGLVVRERLAAVKSQHREAELDLLSTLGLMDLEDEVMALVKNMKRIAGFNLRCFVGVYGEKGMVVG